MTPVDSYRGSGGGHHEAEGYENRSRSVTLEIDDAQPRLCHQRSLPATLTASLTPPNFYRTNSAPNPYSSTAHRPPYQPQVSADAYWSGYGHTGAPYPPLPAGPLHTHQPHVPLPTQPYTIPMHSQHHGTYTGSTAANVGVDTWSPTSVVQFPGNHSSHHGPPCHYNHSDHVASDHYYQQQHHQQYYQYHQHQHQYHWTHHQYFSHNMQDNTAVQHGHITNSVDKYERPANYGELPEGLDSEFGGGPGTSASSIDYASIRIPKSVRDAAPIRGKLITKEFAPWSKQSQFIPSGRRRALLIGIHYSGSAELRGPKHDVEFTRYLLRHKFGFQREDFRILMDREPDSYIGEIRQPTREEILNGMRWLVEGAQAGDSLWLSFSGHGAQIPDTSNDEPDGMDEAILPVDYATSSYIVDDEMHHILVRGTPCGARLTILFDACHCGSGMDLPCEYSLNGKFTYTGIKSSEESRLIRPAEALSWESEPSTGFVSIDQPEMCSHSRVGEVIMLSGCRDDQMSAENHNGASTTGVMTFLLIRALEWKEGPYGHMGVNNYLELIQHMTEVIKKVKGCQGQTPQISTSHPFDLTSPFYI